MSNPTHEHVLTSPLAWILRCDTGHIHAVRLHRGAHPADSVFFDPWTARDHCRSCGCDHCGDCTYTDDDANLQLMRYPHHTAAWEAGGWLVETVTEEDLDTLSPAVWRITSPDGETLTTTAPPTMLHSALMNYAGVAYSRPDGTVQIHPTPDH